MVAGFASLGVHGAALLVVMLLVRERVVVDPPTIELTPIQVVEPPPTPPTPPTPARSLVPAAKSRSSGTRGRRGGDAPPRSLSQAPATSDPFADVVVSYEAPTSREPGHPAGSTGIGRGAGLAGHGTGDGAGGPFGLGNVPPAPKPSLARPPRPKRDYRSWDFRAERRFAGAILQVELTIDPQGRVHDVRVLRGVDASIDKHAIGLARRFAFHPALDDAGDPTWGVHRWEFVLVGDLLPDRLPGGRRW